ncbi:MAG: hypothetical protein R3D69_13085 [Xanthobacteraceae bacterium]
MHAVIYTHSHTGPLGRRKGVISQAEVDPGKASVIAPEGFPEAIADENIRGPLRCRDGYYQFGGRLPKGERGQVDGPGA